jgi:hypothetical protein
MSALGLVVSYMFSTGRVAFRIPWKSLSGYLGAAALMILAMYPVNAIISPSSMAIFQSVRLGVLLVVGVTTYLGTVLTLDKEGRILVKLLIKRLVS